MFTLCNRAVVVCGSASRRLRSRQQARCPGQPGRKCWRNDGTHSQGNDRRMAPKHPFSFCQKDTIFCEAYGKSRPPCPQRQGSVIEPTHGFTSTDVAGASVKERGCPNRSAFECKELPEYIPDAAERFGMLRLRQPRSGNGHQPVHVHPLILSANPHSNS